MRGYRNNPEANAEVFIKDGWFRTGDLGVADESGCLQIRDRLKELIKVSNIVTNFVNILLEHALFTKGKIKKSS